MVSVKATLKAKEILAIEFYSQQTIESGLAIITATGAGISQVNAIAKTCGCEEKLFFKL